MLASRNAQYGSSRAAPPLAESTNEQQPAASPSPIQHFRPSHFRSRSYLSGLTTPVEPKPRNALPLSLQDPSSKNANGVAHADRAGRDHVDESSASSFIPRIHLPYHKHRHSQDSKNGNGSAVTNGGANHGKQHYSHLLGRSNSYHRHTRSEAYTAGAVNATAMNEAFLYPGAGLGVGAGAAAGKSGHSMISRVASNLSSKNVGLPQHQHSTSDFHKSWNASQVGVAGASGVRPGARRRATSDPRAPVHGRPGVRDGTPGHFVAGGYFDASAPRQETRRPMSEVEVLLYKAERARREAETNVGEEDLSKLSVQLAEANVELRDHLDRTTHTSTNLMRRLDDAYYSLASTASSLTDTISSFQTLCEQSSVLTENFQTRSHELDDEMRQALDKHQKALFEERGAKIAALEERSKKANDRAEEMSRRLEHCRTIVKNYTVRQQTKQRAWKGVLVGSFCGVCIIAFGILLGFVLWWYKNYGDLVRYDIHEAVALALDGKGLGHAQGRLHEIVRDCWSDGTGQCKSRVLETVPEDVRAVLEDIAARHNGTGGTTSIQQDSAATAGVGTTGDDKQLWKLFEKLEL